MTRRSSLRRWVRPWLATGTTGLVVFGLLHQVLVDVAPFVFVGLPMALVLSVPIVAAYATIPSRSDPTTGPVLGLVAVAGFTVHYPLITVAMWDRTFDDGPRGGWQLLAIVGSPVVAGMLSAIRFRSGRSTALLVVAMAAMTVMISGFQESEPDWRNVGAYVSLLPSCVAAGWVLQRTAPERGTERTFPATPRVGRTPGRQPWHRGPLRA